MKYLLFQKSWIQGKPKQDSWSCSPHLIYICHKETQLMSYLWKVNVCMNLNWTSKSNINGTLRFSYILFLNVFPLYLIKIVLIHPPWLLYEVLWFYNNITPLKPLSGISNSVFLVRTISCSEYKFEDSKVPVDMHGYSRNVSTEN